MSVDAENTFDKIHTLVHEETPNKLEVEGTSST